MGSHSPIRQTSNVFLSPEMRSIKDSVEPLSRENRKIVETAVIELVKILNHPLKDEPLTFSPMQKVFLRLFRK